MNTPTPRTDTEITFTGAYTCTHHNDAERTACPVCLVTALTAERDQLRAENITLRAAQKACETCDEPTAFEVRQLRADCENKTKWAAHYLAESIADKSRAEKAERAETVALTNWNGALERAMKAEAERDHLHDQLRALTLICGTNDANKFETWIDRANARAEEAEAELAAERARLDSGTILLTVAGEQVWHCGVDLRAAIDAAMKAGAT